MAIGKRIRFFRNKKGMTQKQLGELLGFLGKSSDVRMAQYESETRIPKNDLVKRMAAIFNVSTHALNVPDIDSYIGLMHTFFALEDMYGLKIREIDEKPCLYLDESNYLPDSPIYKGLHAWQLEAAKLESGKISKEQYDEWRYTYPDKDTTRIWAKVPSEEFCDMFLKELMKTEKKEKKKKKK